MQINNALMQIIIFGGIEQFSIGYRKIKTEVNTPTKSQQE